MKKYVRSDTSSKNSDFVVEDGVLLKYRGNSKHVIVPDGVSEIGKYAFYEYDRMSDIERIVLPSGLTRIDDSAFMNCKRLREVIIPNSVEYLSGFYGCISIRSIKIPRGVKTIGDNAFTGCTKLVDALLPDSVSSIGYAAFMDCRSLVNVDITDNVQYIGFGAFAGCVSLNSRDSQKIESILARNNRSIDTATNKISSEETSIIRSDIKQLTDSLKAMGYAAKIVLNLDRSEVDEDEMSAVLDVTCQGKYAELTLSYYRTDENIWELSRDLEYEADDLIDYFNELS